MIKLKEMEITPRHMLIPMALMAFTLLLLFAFQMTQILGDRDALHARLTSQTQEVEVAQKINAQFGGLVMGTRQLANAGNKGAAKLVEELKRAGIIPSAPPQAAQSPVPVPQEASPAPQKP